jgi:hypothetical protein
LNINKELERCVNDFIDRQIDNISPVQTETITKNITYRNAKGRYRTTTINNIYVAQQNTERQIPEVLFAKIVEQIFKYIAGYAISFDEATKLLKSYNVNLNLRLLVNDEVKNFPCNRNNGGTLISFPLNYLLNIIQKEHIQQLNKPILPTFESTEKVEFRQPTKEIEVTSFQSIIKSLPIIEEKKIIILKI